MRRLAVYGRGGVGKSTTTSNVSAALAEAGHRVVQIGCCPRGDSTSTLRDGRPLQSLFDALQGGARVTLPQVSIEGYRGILCLEAGGPAQGECFGQGVETVFRLLDELRVAEEFRPDFVLYDVPGDSLCSAYLAPIRERMVDGVFAVTNADLLSLHAANGILGVVAEHAATGGPKLAGLVANGLDARYGRAMVDEFGWLTRSNVVSYIPRSLAVARSDLYGQTVIEAAPASAQAQVYRTLARRVAERNERAIPLPMDPAQLRTWLKSWGSRMLDIESGVVGEMACI